MVLKPAATCFFRNTTTAPGAANKSNWPSVDLSGTVDFSNAAFEAKFRRQLSHRDPMSLLALKVRSKVDVSKFRNSNSLKRVRLLFLNRADPIQNLWHGNVTGTSSIMVANCLESKPNS